jgi:hypothetical protein
MQCNSEGFAFLIFPWSRFPVAAGIVIFNLCSLGTAEVEPHNPQSFLWPGGLWLAEANLNDPSDYT